MIIIDGSRGEGGGQVLRSSLSMSMLTGRAFTLKNIRGCRPKPGLRKQHLSCVLAAAEICHAQVSGADFGSTELVFIPGEIQAGSYLFDIQSAGSVGLVLQTILPALLHKNEES